LTSWYAFYYGSIVFGCFLMAVLRHDRATLGATWATAAFAFFILFVHFSAAGCVYVGISLLCSSI